MEGCAYFYEPIHTWGLDSNCDTGRVKTLFTVLEFKKREKF